ncbi:MAG: cellulase family glycosylhydrolase [Tepidisphaerales bacterium]
MDHRTVHRFVAPALVTLLSLAGSSAHAQTTRPLSRISVDREHRTLRTADGSPFIPFGVNYFRPDTGWAPQLWKKFDPEVTRRDLDTIKRLGGNSVRVFISFGSFYTTPGRLDPEGVARFDRFLELAEQAGLYVHPTGPDHWEGTPPWARGDRFADEQHLKALEDFWRLFAGRYKDRPAILAYDLLNEPHVPWTTPAIAAQWQKRTGRTTAPDPKADPPDPQLLDYQRLREEVAEQWTRRQAAAIHAADPRALVSVGLIQWSIPATRMSVSQYSGFRPARVAPHLDFMEVHFYPLAAGAYRYESAEAEEQNLAYVESVAREAAKPGLPLVLAEFGWGGGAWKNLAKMPPQVADENQAKWCAAMVRATRPLACGWLNWGLYDTPEATDVSQGTGLLEYDGREKPWARAFAELAAEVRKSPSPSAEIGARPDLPWEACLTSPKAMEQFRLEYIAAFRRARQTIR